MSVKKKMQQEYTPDTQWKIINNVVDFFLKFKEIAFVISTIIMVALSMFYAYKSAPLIQADRDADFRITALEKDNIRFESNLIRIEGKIDQLLLK